MEPVDVTEIVRVNATCIHVPTDVIGFLIKGPKTHKEKSVGRE
jgi:hypothetical protein